MPQARLCQHSSHILYRKLHQQVVCACGMWYVQRHHMHDTHWCNARREGTAGEPGDAPGWLCRGEVRRKWAGKEHASCTAQPVAAIPGALMLIVPVSFRSLALVSRFYARFLFQS